uniref:Vexin n=1 Tax=Ursus maritimus TaxID=29073 RepID=A0A452UF31_URSMA
MHQIYSCSDENIEVFTTVIPSKVSSPARRRVKSSQHLLTKNPHRTPTRKTLPGEHGRFHSPSLMPPLFNPTVGSSEPKSSNLCGNRAYGKSLIPPVARISVKAPGVLEAAAAGSENGGVLTRGSRHLKKMTEEYPTLPQGAEASLPLTGSASCGVPSILRKMWTRHKKKSEYVGATNSAFEAD